MPAGEGLARLVDASAILSAEQQAFVAARHAEDEWSVDPSAATVTLISPGGRATVCRAHFLGTSAPGPSTWLWGWRNINGFPPAFVALAERVRVVGEAQGVAELTTAELPLTDALPRRLAIAAKTVTGIAAHYSGPIGGGSRAWVLIEHPDLVLPQPAVRTAMEAILGAVGSVEIGDHAEALVSWARQRGVMFVPGDAEGRTLRLTLPDGQLLVVLDDEGRIGRVETEQPVGLDASAALHGGSAPPQDSASEDAAPSRTAPQHPDDLPTEAIDLPVQEEPLAPEPDPEPQPQPQTAAPTEDEAGHGRAEDREHGNGDGEDREEEPEEGPMRRLLGFLRGPKP